MSDDDSWQELKKTVKPLKNPKPVVTPVIKLKKVVLPSRDSELPALKRLDHSAASPLPFKRLKQLRQKKIPVEATIDLHGMTIIKAHEVVEKFLINAYRNGLRCVEVVTGKGDPVRGTGQLKREFPQWLSQLPLIILHYEENPASRGGSYLVMLRRSRTVD